MGQCDMTYMEWGNNGQCDVVFMGLGMWVSVT